MNHRCSFRCRAVHTLSNNLVIYFCKHLTYFLIRKPVISERLCIYKIYVIMTGIYKKNQDNSVYMVLRIEILNLQPKCKMVCKKKIPIADPSNFLRGGGFDE